MTVPATTVVILATSLATAQRNASHVSVILVVQSATIAKAVSFSVPLSSGIATDFIIDGHKKDNCPEGGASGGYGGGYGGGGYDNSGYDNGGFDESAGADESAAPFGSWADDSADAAPVNNGGW